MHRDNSVSAATEFMYQCVHSSKVELIKEILKSHLKNSLDFSLSHISVKIKCRVVHLRFNSSVNKLLTKQKRLKVGRNALKVTFLGRDVLLK